MGCEPYQCLALDQSFSNTQRNSKAISGTGASAKLIDNSETILIDISVQTRVSTPNQLLIWLDITYLRMNAVSLISDAKVETFASMLSSIDTRAKS
jgi:hypothetical protein